MNARLHPGSKWNASYVLLASHFVSLSASFYLSYHLLPYYRPYLRPETFTFGSFSAHAWLLLIIFPLWHVLLQGAGLIRPTRLPWRIVFERTVRVQCVGLAALSVLVFVFKLQTVSRLLIFGFCFLAVPISLAARRASLALLETHRAHIYNVARILVVGSRERAKEFIRQARGAEGADYEIVGCLEPDATATPKAVEGVPVLGSTDIFRPCLLAHPVDIVVFAMPLERVPAARKLVEATLELGLRLVVLPDFQLPRLGYPVDPAGATIGTLFGIPVAALSDVPRETTYLVLKRVQDIVVSATVLALLAPVFALVALLIKLTSPGPVIFQQERVGLNGRRFVIRKFRTMVLGADQLTARLACRNQMDGPVFKIHNDPRVTRLGRVLRRTSLDEFPQFLNVLLGDMSVVGPRPPLPEEVGRYEFWQRRKLSIKPGITCLWQVNGRNQIKSFDEWARLDLEYVRSASLWLDCKILLKTIPVVLRGRGAY